MKLDPWALSFPPDDVRTGAPLGGFYQDLSAAVGLVLGGVHGPLDPLGRPIAAYVGSEARGNAIIIAQYALACVPAARTGERESLERLRVQADWLVAHQEKDGDARGFWLQRFDNLKYTALRAPWVSALAQGNALSALLRAAEILGEPAYSAAAEIGFEALRKPLGDGGILCETGKDLWLEEYPLDPPGHVLNGAIYALWGVLDVARATGAPEAWRIWRKGAATVARHLAEFDTGFWSRYELATPELVSVHYHRNIHIPQLEVMYALTSEDVFRDVVLRWRRYLRSPLSWTRRRLEGRWRWRRSKAVARRAGGVLRGTGVSG